MKDNLTSRRVVINSIIYTASGLLLKCFSFFLLPLYTQYLSTEDYGITSLSTTFITSMAYVVVLSSFSSIMRFYVDLKDEPARLKRFYGTITNFTWISGLIWIVILVVFKELVSKFIFSGVDFFPVIFVTVLSLLFNCFHTIYSTILRSQQKSLKVSLLSLAYFFFNLGFNLLFVVRLEMGAIGVICATMISNFAYAIFFFFDMYMTRQMVFCLDISLLRSSLKYSIPILPHNLSTQIALLVSKTLIGGVDSLASLGLYSVAFQFGNIAETIQVYVEQAYSPWLYEKLNSKADGYKRNIRQVSNILCSFIGLFFVAVALFSHDYIVLFTEKSYVAAWKMVPLIIAVFGIKTAYYFYVAILFYYKKASRQLFIATVSSSLLNIVLSALAIPQYGAYGSIVCDGIAMMVRVGIVYLISRKYEDIGIKLKDFIFNYLFIMGIITIGLLPSFLHYSTYFSLTNFIYKVFVVLMYVVAIAYRYKNGLIKVIEMVKKRKHKGTQ